MENGIRQSPFLFDTLIYRVAFYFAKGGKLESSELKNAGYNGIDVPIAVVVISGVSFCPNGVNCGGKTDPLDDQ